MADNVKMQHRQRKLRARFAETPADVQSALTLRRTSFFNGVGVIDGDEFDHRCLHVLIEDSETTELLCCYRLLPLSSGPDVMTSYSAQFYDLSALSKFSGSMVEVGRFCIAANARDPNVLRAAWAVMTKYVDELNIELLFGCSSFKGTDASAHLESFSLLADCHLAPKLWLPKVKAAKVFHFASKQKSFTDRAKALRKMPPVLKTYLSMGGWVSNHAVVDYEMNTMHVFTGLEVKNIPAARKRLLRVIAAQMA